MGAYGTGHRARGRNPNLPAPLLKYRHQPHESGPTLDRDRGRILIDFKYAVKPQGLQNDTALRLAPTLLCRTATSWGNRNPKLVG